MRNFVKMQEEAKYDSYFFIADLHALTTHPDPKTLHENVCNILCEYLAAGLDPDKSTLFVQSDIPEISEMYLLMNMHVGIGELMRTASFKEKIRKHPDNINAGLLCYPVLMAADILTFNSDIVPVGKDQVQHVEIARDIAGAINAHYGKDLLHLPEYYIDEHVAVVPGIDGRKMSKSYGNVIPLFEDDKAIKKAIFSIKTDSRPMEEPKDPEGILVYEIYKSIATAEQLREMADGLRQGKLGYGHIKNMLLEAVVNEIKDAREKYNYYMAHYDEVEEMLAAGAAKARPVARKTLERLKDAVFGR